MAGLCEGGNEPPGSLKASNRFRYYSCHLLIPGVTPPLCLRLKKSRLYKVEVIPGMQNWRERVESMGKALVPRPQSTGVDIPSPTKSMTRGWKEREVKRRIAMAKEGFNRKRSTFCVPLEKELRKRLVECFVWSVASYGGGAETSTMRRREGKRIEAFECECGEEWNV
ncbi:hypothetical protein ANN_15467 [Periplaneta americana]|uniref:Uncharacterized protein n=1 Tax=Periplaneta americana TaxID=6978 RepID=A0ABQ8SGG9_PERAM|nr:hypothetical protein ANN_15467 [Periplaneta americana]